MNVAAIPSPLVGNVMTSPPASLSGPGGLRPEPHFDGSVVVLAGHSLIQTSRGGRAEAALSASISVPSLQSFQSHPPVLDAPDPPPPSSSALYSRRELPRLIGTRASG